MSNPPSVLEEVAAERIRQDEKWGEQNHPDGTGGPEMVFCAELSKRMTDQAAQNGTLTYLHILEEEICEAFAETDKQKLRTELIQVAAVAVAWVEKIDRGF